MGMPVKLSDELVASARKEAASTDRSITGQIENLAKIGRSVETVPARRAVQAVLERLITEKNRGPLASRLKAGRVVYQSDPAGSGLTERLSPDGTRTLGRLANRRFVPARPTRSRGR